MTPPVVDFLYDLLGVSPTTTDHEIKKAFQARVLELHPDKNPDDPDATEKFQELKEAYEILRDTDSRARYDRYGIAPESQSDDDLLRSILRSRMGFCEAPTRRTDNILHALEMVLVQLYTILARSASYLAIVSLCAPSAVGAVVRPVRLPKSATTATAEAKLFRAFALIH
jgi:hypothetical protein